MSSFLRSLMRMIALVLTCILAGFVLLVAAYALPIGRIAENVKNSSYTLEREWEYPKVDTINGPQQLDNFTDALMMMEAAFESDDGLVTQALSSRYFTLEGMSPFVSFFTYYNHPAEVTGERFVHAYARYWHGYLIYLKPLLCFFRYYQIRKIYLFAQAAVLLAVLLMMVRRRLIRYIPPFLLSILLLSPSVIAKSLQFSSIYFVLLAAMLSMLVFQPRLVRDDRYPLFFTLIGCVTSYVDFLTAPLLTLCFPLALYFCMNMENAGKNLISAVRLGFCWGVGYVGMWAGKWVLASLLTEHNVIRDALSTISVRTSFIDEAGIAFSYPDVLQKNWAFIGGSPLLWLALLFMVGCIWLILRGHDLGRLSASFAAFAPICLLPLAWFYLASNHAYWHAFFAYRIFIAIPLAGMCLFASSIAEPQMKGGNMHQPDDPGVKEKQADSREDAGEI